MTTKTCTEAEIKNVVTDVVLDLWVNRGLGTPDIAKVVRVDQEEAERIIATHPSTTGR